MRLIDADALMKKWLDQPDPPFKCDSEVALMEKLCSDWIDLINEAPTIEPSGDLISRKSLNDIKFIAIKGDKVEEAYRSGWNGAIECIIENAPFEEKLAEREWIPCSERLPEKDGWYLITIQGYEKVVDMEWYYSEWGAWNGVSSEQQVIAWTPLPKPYKGGEEECV